MNAGVDHVAGADMDVTGSALRGFGEKLPKSFDLRRAPAGAESAFISSGRRFVCLHGGGHLHG